MILISAVGKTYIYLYIYSIKNEFIFFNSLFAGLLHWHVEERCYGGIQVDVFLIVSHICCKIYFILTFHNFTSRILYYKLHYKFISIVLMHAKQRCYQIFNVQLSKIQILYKSLFLCMYVYKYFQIYTVEDQNSTQLGTRG